ncbi:MAG: hypothetical protein PHS41_11125, partial [Victivallaceae bacterium]|nr:hypothetical protein [Victivallaceae bacterium]
PPPRAPQPTAIVQLDDTDKSPVDGFRMNREWNEAPDFECGYPESNHRKSGSSDLFRGTGRHDASFGSVVQLEDLERILADPAAAYLLENCMLRPGASNAAMLSAEEPFALGSLDAYTAKLRLWQGMVANRSAAEVGTNLRRTGILPPGEIGTRALEELQDLFLEVPADFLADFRRMEPRVLEWECGASKLCGRVPLLPEGTRSLYFFPTRYKYSNYVRLLLRHLLLSAAGPEEFQDSTGIFLSSRGVDKMPVLFAYCRDAAAARLEDCLALAAEILARPHFLPPESLLAYQEKPGDDPEMFFASAGKNWEKDLQASPGLSRHFTAESWQQERAQQDFLTFSERFFTPDPPRSASTNVPAAEGKDGKGAGQ